MEFIKKYNLIHLYLDNTEETQLTIINLLTNKPEDDIEGFIYGFRPPNFTNCQTVFKVKIGKTK